MVSEWLNCTLGDCITLLSGGTPSKSKPEYWGGEIPWVSAKDMKTFWLKGSEDRLTPLGAEEATRVVGPGTTLLLVRGMTLHNDIPICRVRRTSTFNQDVKAVIPKGGIDGSFLPHLLVALKPRLLSIVDSAGHGTGRLGTETLMALPIQLPGLHEQHEIAVFAEAIEEKIALLRETNAILEAIAQALFKSWFVDFDPVRAKAEGRDPEGVPPEVADLFPSEFEDSELGVIPKGWRVGTVGDIAQVIDCLHSKKPIRTESGPTLLQLGNILDSGLMDLSDRYCICKEDYDKWTSRMEVIPGDCVITNVGRVGAVAQMPVGEQAAMGRNMTGLRNRKQFPYPTFLIECLQSGAMRLEMKRKTDMGTILDALNVRSIPNLRFCLPDSSVAKVFEDIARPARARMELNLKEILSLATMRDTLLPRLMSGKLRIPDLPADSV